MRGKYKVLVTGIGGVIGYGIVKSLKMSSYDVEIYGMDIYADAYGRFLVDHFIHGVRADAQEFLPFLKQVIKKHGIDLVFPSLDPEIYKIFRQKESLPGKFVLNTDHCIELSADKLATFQFLKENSRLTLIPTLHNVDFERCASKLGLPFLLKPVCSSASRGIQVISEKEEFEFYSKKIRGECIYQKIVGHDKDEYTIAVFGDRSGNFLDHIILRRTLFRTGATEKASLVKKDPRILDYVQQICKVLKPVGPTNIQVRKEQDQVYLLEINARISSTCSIRTCLGYNEPEMCISYFLANKKIEPQPKIPASVTRYIADCINYEKGCDNF